MKNKIIFSLSFVLILFPRISLAAVNLPWSTTYNCPDWTQSNGLNNVNCDGLTGHGTWTTTDGKEEQITAAANFPGGGGGRGQRSWNADGYDNNSGGMHLSFTSAYSEIWIRWYMRYENGFSWNPLDNDKILIVNVNSPCYVVLMWSWMDEIAAEVNGKRYGSGVGNGWNTVMSAGGTDNNGNKSSDGQWHLYEVHLKMDTNGGNGVAEWWIDGVKRLFRNDVNYGTCSGWSSVLISSNQIWPLNGRSMYIDFDDITISNTGPIGGNTPPPSGGNPPSNNSGNNSSASGGSGCGFVKDDGKGQKAKGEGLAFAIMLIMTLAGIALVKKYFYKLLN